MMTKKFLLTALMAVFALGIHAQVEAPKDAPQLEFALQLKVTLGETFYVQKSGTFSMGLATIECLYAPAYRAIAPNTVLNCQ